MRIIHLPTLDGTVEASVARLEAWERRCTFDAIDSELEDAHAEAEEIRGLVGPSWRPDGRINEKRAEEHLKTVGLSHDNVRALVNVLVAS